MHLPTAVLIFALLVCGAGDVEAQTPSVRGGAPAVRPGAGPGPAPRITPEVATGRLLLAPAPRPEYGTAGLHAAAVSAPPRAPRRGVIIGALVGGVAAGAFSYHLREDTGTSPFREMAGPVLAGAAVGALLGGVVQALIDR